MSMTDYYTEVCFLVKPKCNEEFVWLINNCPCDVVQVDKGLVIEGQEVDIQEIVDFLQNYLQEFDIDKPIAFTYASTSSRPVLGGYSGGGAIVWKDRDIVRDGLDVIREYMDGWHGV